jgi:predicted polyphosphate/ATP-dependent NAD kinase
MEPITVGIVANPASGRDIRRLVARGSVFPTAEKCNMIVRLLGALAATGVQRVLVMPDTGGVSARLRRTLATCGPAEQWPHVEFLDMPVEDGPRDTLRAVRRMAAENVGAIVVLGGDGTHRLVATACHDIPLTSLSTGTNNVFPEMREATVAGLATGLIATGKVSTAEGTRRNKVLRIEIDGSPSSLAVVDVSIATDTWAGARALWRPENISHIFVAFAEPDAIGLSAVAGLLQPVSRCAPHGLRVDLAPASAAAFILHAPIAPGLIVPIGVTRVCEIRPGERQAFAARQGMIALDGERELEFRSDQRVTLWLDADGPRTVDTGRVMTISARDGLLRTCPQSAVEAVDDRLPRRSGH